MYTIGFKFEDSFTTYSIQQLTELSKYNWNSFKWANVVEGDTIHANFKHIYHDFIVKKIDHIEKRVILTNKR